MREHNLGEQIAHAQYGSCPSPREERGEGEGQTETRVTRT